MYPLYVSPSSTRTQFPDTHKELKQPIVGWWPEVLKVACWALGRVFRHKLSQCRRSRSISSNKLCTGEGEQRRGTWKWNIQRYYRRRAVAPSQVFKLFQSSPNAERNHVGSFSRLSSGSGEQCLGVSACTSTAGTVPGACLEQPCWMACFKDKRKHGQQGPSPSTYLTLGTGFSTGFQQRSHAGNQTILQTQSHCKLP